MEYNVKKLILLLSTIVFLQTIVFAQDSDSNITSTENSDTTEINFWKKHNVNIAAVPMINYDPAIEWNFALLANAFFQFDLADTLSPLSMAGAMAGYTTNKSWYWAVYARVYFDYDNYRATIAYGDASIKFQYYEGAISSFVNFTSGFDAFYIEGSRRIFNRWYLGLRYVNLMQTTIYDLEGVVTTETNMNNLGYAIAHDTRDFIYNPNSGDYLNLKTGYYRDFLGSDYKFNNYEFDFTKFFSIDTSRVMVGRFSAKVATGDVPFEGQHVVQRDDMRGYTDGKYRGEQVYTLQTAYRWNIYKKWGMVAFGGIATAVNSLSEIKFDRLLPAIGVGVRYMAIPSEKINIGIDVAIGKNDWGMYFRIAEAFGDK